MPAAPKIGDVILRGSSKAGFVLLDADTGQRIAGPMQLSRAVQVARSYGADAVWQQSVDERGRPLGPPARFALP